MTNSSADARRRQIRLTQLILAGAATFATLALFSAGPSDPQAAVASGSVRLADQITDLQAPTPASPGPLAAPLGSGASGGIIAVNDDDVNNPSDGDIFTQNAQDQSTASGAGTSYTQVAPSSTGNIVAVDDDTNPSSGDIFTQNAEDQSTASGAGT